MNGSVFLYVALLHHDFMLSSLMVSRQMSYSASVRIYLTPPPPFCHFGGSNEEVGENYTSASLTTSTGPSIETKNEVK